MANQIAAEGPVIGLPTAVVVAFSSNLALDCRFGLTLEDNFSLNQDISCYVKYLG